MAEEKEEATPPVVLPSAETEASLRARGLCGARLKREHADGATRCAQPGTGAGGRCRFHGGATPPSARAAFRNYRGADLPDRLGEAFLRALEDPELTSLAQELALVDARAVELVEQLPTGETGAAWDAVHGALAEARAALDADPPRADRARAALERAAGPAQAAQQERALWGELYEALEARRRLADTERRREADLEAALTAKQAAQLVGAIVAAVAEIVRDPSEKLALAARIGVLLDGGGQRARRAQRALEAESEVVEEGAAGDAGGARAADGPAAAGREGGSGPGTADGWQRPVEPGPDLGVTSSPFNPDGGTA